MQGDAAAGEPLSANCGGCHGSHGVSHDATIPSLAAQDPRYRVEAITAYRDEVRVHEGMREFMANISDKQIQDIAAFYATQSSRPAEANPLTVKELAERCDRCHDASGHQRCAQHSVLH